jgi:tRNA(Ile)-lysidine synthase
MPRRVVSVTVDHRLQPSSSAMADFSAKTAQSLRVDYVTKPVLWSTPPFPQKPAENQAFEKIAREARQHVLFDIMTRIGAKVLALGHHADDQVETSLMRLGRHTTELGVGGMRRCRRWGMGHGKGEGSLGWAGYEGMNRWMVRPLLDVGKVSRTQRRS